MKGLHLLSPIYTIRELALSLSFSLGHAAIERNKRKIKSGCEEIESNFHNYRLKILGAKLCLQ